MGQVAGMATLTGNTIGHAVVWNGTIATDLGSPGGSSYAFAINNIGQVAGYAEFGNRTPHAILWSNNTAIDLNSYLDSSIVGAGWLLLGATGINDNGWIVGVMRNSVSGYTHGVLLSVSAVPEPETHTMMFAGLGLIGFMLQRRKGIQAI